MDTRRPYPRGSYGQHPARIHLSFGGTAPETRLEVYRDRATPDLIIRRIGAPEDNAKRIHRTLCDSLHSAARQFSLHTQDNRTVKMHKALSIASVITS